MTTTETTPNTNLRTGSIPVRATTETKAGVDSPPLPQSEPELALTGHSGNRPQSSPPAGVGARLSRQDLRDLIRYCDDEIGHWFLTQEQGRRALELKGKLQAIHAHGWQS